MTYRDSNFARAEAAYLRAPEWDDPDPNELQAALEERCEDEIDRLDAYFTEWLADSEHAVSIALAVTYWPGRDLIDGRYPTRQECDDKRAENMDEALGRMARDYIAHRANDSRLMGELAASIAEDERNTYTED